jgi:antitoxin Phd
MARTPKWQLQDAKNRLSEVVEAAIHDGPQIITRRGEETAVVLSFRDWSKLARRGDRLIDVLRRAPKVPGGLNIDRSKDTGRDVDL